MSYKGIEFIQCQHQVQGSAVILHKSFPLLCSVRFLPSYRPGQHCSVCLSGTTVWPWVPGAGGRLR